MTRFVFLFAWLSMALRVMAADPVFQWDATPGAGRVAAFKMWLPGDVQQLDAMLILVPGHDGDGRGMADDADWQALARYWHCGIVACKMRGDSYDTASRWSGNYVMQSLKEFARQSGHAEIEEAPLLFWGHSAGGAYSASFAEWKPDRVIAYVPNKGTSPINLDARKLRIPALWIAAAHDQYSYIPVDVTNAFVAGRRAGAPWALAVQPNAGHEVGDTKMLGILFFDSVFRCRRLQADGKPVTAWTGDFVTHEIAAATTAEPRSKLNSWMPDEKFARAWHDVVTGTPLPSLKEQGIFSN